MPYTSGMIETTLPLPPEVWQATPPEAQALISALHERVCDLEARLGQDASNSSRPPSADPPQAPAKVKRQAPPSGRKRGGQPGHPGHFRTLRPPEQVDQVVVVASEVCRHCGQPFPTTTPRRQVRVWRHQVVELLTLTSSVDSTI